MTASKPKPVTITVGETQRVSGLLAGAAAGARLLRVRARGRRRHGASVHGRGRDRTCRTRHRQLALSIPVYGGGRQAPRSAEARAGRGARGGRRSRAASAVASAHCRRQILRRPHDLAGASRVALAGRARARLSRFSAASGGQTIGRARRASVRCENPDAVPAGHARCAGGGEAAEAGDQTARHARDAHAVRGRRPFLPCAGALRAARMPTCGARCWMRSRHGRSR